MEYPELYKSLLEGNFVFQTGSGNYNAAAPDMKLEQTIQRSKKGAGGVISQTKQDAFVTEWDLFIMKHLQLTNVMQKLQDHFLLRMRSLFI